MDDFNTRPGHLLRLPKWLLAFRILQIVTAVAVLGLAGYGITFFAFDGIELNLFTAIATVIIVGYVLLATFVWPIMYNYWAILGLDMFAVVFWLVSFALLASEIATVKGLFIEEETPVTCVVDDFGFCEEKRSLVLAKRATTTLTTYYDAMSATAGLGGLEFALFIVTLVLTGIHLHRHRKAGGHCTPSRNTMAAASVPAGQKVEL